MVDSRLCRLGRGRARNLPEKNGCAVMGGMRPEERAGEANAAARLFPEKRELIGAAKRKLDCHDALDGIAHSVGRGIDADRAVQPHDERGFGLIATFDALIVRWPRKGLEPDHAIESRGSIIGQATGRAGRGAKRQPKKRRPHHRHPHSGLPHKHCYINAFWPRIGGGTNKNPREGSRGSVS